MLIRWIRRLLGLETITIQLQRLEFLMFNAADTLAHLDVATNSVAVYLQSLKDEVGSAVTPEQAAKFDAAIARLNALAADPNNPVPVAPDMPTAQPSINTQPPVNPNTQTP